MNRFSHVLDTSAILAHYFDESGAGFVDDLWSGSGTRCALSAVTVTELKSRLMQELTDGWAGGLTALEGEYDACRNRFSRYG